MFDFSLTEDQRIAVETVRRFAEQHLAPVVEECEEAERFPMEVFRKFGRAGYLATRVPAKYGGADIDKVTECLVREELSRVSQGFESSWSVHNMVTRVLADFGSDAQQGAYLPAAVGGEIITSLGVTEPDSGSDVKGIRTRARRDRGDWVINGSKMFITNGTLCEFALVLCWTNDSKDYRNGMSLLLVPRESAGFVVSQKLRKEGIRMSETAELTFQDCRVPLGNVVGEEGKGFYHVMEFLSENRIAVAAGCVGIARAALEASIEYASRREAFGRPIGGFQAIQHKIADMATEADAARLITLRAGWMLDQGMPTAREASMAKLFASEVAVRAASEAMQIHGGYGIMREFPVGRLLRDARVYTVGEGTSEIQRNIISQSLLGVRG